MKNWPVIFRSDDTHFTDFFLIVFPFYLKLCRSLHPPSLSCPFNQSPSFSLHNPMNHSGGGGGTTPIHAPLATPLRIIKCILCIFFWRTKRRRTNVCDVQLLKYIVKLHTNLTSFIFYTILFSSHISSLPSC